MDLDKYLSTTAPAGAAASVTLPAEDTNNADSHWRQIDPLDMLPNGQPLKCTLRRTIILADVFGADHPPFPKSLAAVLLFLCAHDASVWSVPVRVAPGDTRPLWRAPDALMAAAMEWADSALSNLTPLELSNLASRLWLYQNETRVIPQKKTTGAEMIRPASSLASATNGFGSPVAETPSAPPSLPTASPCESSTLTSTAPSLPAE